MLRGKLAGTEEVIGFLKGQVEDLKQEREGWKAEADDWKEQARAAQRLLEDHSKRQYQGWLDKLMGRSQSGREA